MRREGHEGLLACQENYLIDRRIGNLRQIRDSCPNPVGSFLTNPPALTLREQTVNSLKGRPPYLCVCKIYSVGPFGRQWEQCKKNPFQLLTQ